MKPSLLNKLQSLAERQQDRGARLADPQVIGDQNRFRSLSQEYAEIHPVVECFSRYRRNEAAIAASRELLNDADRELRTLAEDEIQRAQSDNEELAVEMQRLLLPKDPADNSNIFLEVRAGTGGDEAALFAGTLMRMYTRYAESQGWKIEVLSASESDLAGYREIIMRVIGDGAYSKLKFESGAHRVQRVPETEAQ